jgi:hypothetical protein
MSFCTTTELATLTNTATVRTPTVLQAIIDESDRQITSYLKAEGYTATACDQTKSASLALSKAGLLELGLQEGTLQISNQDYSSNFDVYTAVKELRIEAFKYIDQWMSTQTSANEPRKKYLMKVN